MTGANRRMRQELMGLGTVLNRHKGACWSAQWETVLSVTSLRQERCSGKSITRVMGVDRRGQKSEVKPHFPAPYKHYCFYMT
jgi:hypothetical protein